VKVQIEKQLEVILSLGSEEARWLKNIMQNPLSNECDPSLEDPQDRER
jgi:hypothetical protein